MTVRQDVTTLGPMQIVEMFAWDATMYGASQVLRWHAGTTEKGEPVEWPITWQGIVYEPYPVEASDFEMNSAGTLPRPKLRAANIGGYLSAFIGSLNGDGLGSRVTRKRTLGKYLDAVNFDAGNPQANPNTSFPDEIYYLSRKSSVNPIFVEFELAVPWDVEGIKLPRRQVIAGTCQWEYRSAECSYAGPAVLNDPIYPGVDRCGKTLTSCKLRFGQTGVLRTSAFPSSLLARYV